MNKTYNAQSITISRKPGADKNQPKTAFIGLFKENNPHLKALPPLEILEIPEVEEISIKQLNVSLFLRGNDLIINNLKEITLKKEGSILNITGITQ